MLISFDFNRDIKLALTITIFEEKNIYRHDHGQDFGLSSLHYSFVMFCNEIKQYDITVLPGAEECAVQHHRMGSFLIFSIPADLRSYLQ